MITEGTPNEKRNLHMLAEHANRRRKTCISGERVPEFWWLISEGESA